MNHGDDPAEKQQIPVTTPHPLREKMHIPPRKTKYVRSSKSNVPESCDHKPVPPLSSVREV